MEQNGKDHTNNNETLPHSNSGEQPKSILKHREEPLKKRSLVWDEQNLIENETHRTATMKIDEPKTPFNRDYMYHEDHEDPEGPMVPKSPDEHVKTEDMNWNDFSNAFQKAATERSRWDRDSSGSDREDYRSESDDEKKRDFKAKRKNHYNEFLMIKNMKEKVKEDDEDDDNKSSAKRDEIRD